jgi:hypothetical protein
MPPPSKIDTMDEALKTRLNAKLKENGFGDYRGLVAWLNGEGFEISKSTLAKYGSEFKLNLARIRNATEQAKFLANEFPDDDGKLNDALIRQLQAKLFELMQKFEFDASKVDGVKMGRMIADLARAGISQKKLAREIREETRLAAAEDAASAATAQGLSKDTVNFIRAKVLGQEI